MTSAATGRSRAGGTALAVPPDAQQRVFPARPDQVGQARRFVAGLLAGCPVAEDAVFCVSELAGNCVVHSASGQLGGVFTVRAEVREGDHVWLEVSDEGGPWYPTARDGRMHGLEIVRRLASESGVDGDELTGWVVWARLAWSSAGVPVRKRRPGTGAAN